MPCMNILIGQSRQMEVRQIFYVVTLMIFKLSMCCGETVSLAEGTVKVYSRSKILVRDLRNEKCIAT